MFPCNTSLTIPGPIGGLEAVTSCAAQAAQRGGTAVICHPHPLHGGTMQNKVVHTLARSFSELGLRTVRFNFRGVGQSHGTYASGVGETDDALAVLTWVRQHCPLDQIWLAGFSFGAYVSMRAVAQFDVGRLVLVAPPVHLYAELGPPPGLRVPTLVLQGEEDEVVPVTEVRRWLGAQSPAPVVRYFPGVGHYFHGKLNDLRATVQSELISQVPPS